MTHTITYESLANNERIKLQQSMLANLNERIYRERNNLIITPLCCPNEEGHRMEYVARVRGVRFINDSGATNVNATWYSMEKTDGPMVWIVGDEHAKNDYTILQDIVQRKVKAIVCLAKNNKKIVEYFSKSVSIIVKTDNLESAVKSAFCLSEPTDTVLFSPATPSFDMFNGYKDRGEKFKNQVNQL